MDFKGDSDLGDDEIFFGKLTLKEVKKHILMDINEKKLSLAAADKRDEFKNDLNEDFKLIQATSEPNMFLRKDAERTTDENLKAVSDPIFNRPYIKPKPQVALGLENEDSFLDIEKTVTEQCISPNKSKSNLDNTLDLVNFILNNAPNFSPDKEIKQEVVTKIIQHVDDDNSFNCNDIVPKTEFLSQPDPYDTELQKRKVVLNTLPATPIKSRQVIQNATSVTRNIKQEATDSLNTPRNKQAPNLFKTPKMPVSSKKDTCIKKTPSRSKAYEHIASPIATYIKNCPQVPLVKDIHPKKPLPNTSSIPKLMKNSSETKVINKENIVLPPLAYKSAKKTTVINTNKEKWPQSHWAQKLTSSLRKPIVLKHDHREPNRTPLVLQQEDSFADLPLHQADVSVCTQKLAFKKP